MKVAPDKDLDGLLAWLVQRKKDASAPGDRRVTGLRPPDQLDEVSRSHTDDDLKRPGQVPKTVRYIYLKDVKEMQEALSQNKTRVPIPRR